MGERGKGSYVSFLVDVCVCVCTRVFVFGQGGYIYIYIWAGKSSSCVLNVQTVTVVTQNKQ